MDPERAFVWRNEYGEDRLSAVRRPSGMGERGTRMEVWEKSRAKATGCPHDRVYMINDMEAAPPTGCCKCEWAARNHKPCPECFGLKDASSRLAKLLREFDGIRWPIQPSEFTIGQEFARIFATYTFHAPDVVRLHPEVRARFMKYLKRGLPETYRMMRQRHGEAFPELFEGDNEPVQKEAVEKPQEPGVCSGCGWPLYWQDPAAQEIGMEAERDDGRCRYCGELEDMKYAAHAYLREDPSHRGTLCHVVGTDALVSAWENDSPDYGSVVFATDVHSGVHHLYRRDALVSVREMYTERQGRARRMQMAILALFMLLSGLWTLDIMASSAIIGWLTAVPCMIIGGTVFALGRRTGKLRLSVPRLKSIELAWKETGCAPSSGKVVRSL